MPNTLVDFLRQTDPQRAAGLSDDDITLQYANDHDPSELARQYPDWAADYEAIQKRVRTGIQREGLSAGDYVKQAIGSGVRGAAGVLADVPDAIAMAAKGSTDAKGPLATGRIGFGPQPGSPIGDYATHQLAEGIRSLADKVTPEPIEALENSLGATKIPQGIGSTIGFAAGGLAGKAAGVAELASTAALGAASGGVEQYNDAKSKGADDNTAFKAFLLGAGVGTSEALPIEHALHRMDALGGAARPIRQAIIDAVKSATEEGAQEGLQQLAGNAIAKYVLEYDKDRHMLDEVTTNAGVGGASGAIFSSALSALAGLKGRARTSTTPQIAAAAPVEQAVNAATTASSIPRQESSEVPVATTQMGDNELADIAERLLNGDEVDTAAEVPESENARFIRILSDLRDKRINFQPAAPVPAEQQNASASAETVTPSGPVEDTGAGAPTLQTNDQSQNPTASEVPAVVGQPVVASPEEQAQVGAEVGQSADQEVAPAEPTPVQATIEAAKTAASPADETRSIDEIKARADEIGKQADSTAEQLRGVVEARQALEKKGDQASADALATKQKELTDQGIALQSAKNKLDDAATKATAEGVDVSKFINKNAVDYDAGSFSSKKDKAGRALPGYFEFKDGTDSGNQLAALHEQYGATTGKLDKQKIADKLGKLLTAQSRTEEGGSGLTRRVTAWASPDGQIVAASSFALGKTGANSKYRFSVGGEGAQREGIIDLLDKGFKPVASIRLRNGYNNLARHFPSIEAYNAEFGEAAQTQKDAHQTNRASAEDAGAGRTAVSFSGQEGEMSVEVVAPEDADEHVSDAVMDADRGEGKEAQALFEKWLAENSDFIEEIGLTLQDDPTITDDQFFAETLPAIMLPTINRVGGKSLAREDQRALVEKILQAARETYDSIKSSTSGAPKGNEGVAAGAEAAPNGVASGGVQVGSEEAESGPAAGEARNAARNDLAVNQVSEKLIKQVDLLVAEGEMAGEYAEQLKERLLRSENTEEAQEVFEDGVQSYAEYESKRYRLLDEAMPARQWDLATGTQFDSVVVPYTTDAAVRNMAAQSRPTTAPAARSGLLGDVPLSTLQAKYGSFEQALATISREGNRSLSLIAGKLLPAMRQVGAQLSVVDSPDASNGEKSALGWYDTATNAAVANAGAHLNEGDLQTTIIHEAIHAMTSRMGQVFAAQPSLLTPQQRVAFRYLTEIMAEARQAGMKWESMDDANPAIGLDEFIAAALTETQFQAALASQASSTSKNKTLFQRFKEFLASITKAITGGGGDSDLLTKLENGFDNLLQGYNDATSTWNEFKEIGQKDRSKMDMRFRKIDTAPGAEKLDVSDEKSLLAAKMNIASHNDLQRTMAKVFKAAQDARIGVATSVGDVGKFVEGFYQLYFGKAVDPRQNIVDGIKAFASEKGLESPDENTALTDLDVSAQQQATRDSLAIHQRLLNEAQSIYGDVQAKFISTVEQAAEANSRMMDALKRYNDISLLERAVVRFAKKSLGRNNDLGAITAAKTLGVEDAKDAVKQAHEYAAANSDKMADAFQAMATLGLDYSGLGTAKTLSAPDVANAVASSTDARLNILKRDPALLAVAINFAKKYPLDLDMLVVRAEQSSTERKLVSDMIDIAVSDKADAFGIARQQIIPKLSKLGRVADRILQRLQETKEQRKLLNDTATRYQAVIAVFERALKPALDQRIGSMQQYFNAESSYGAGDMWTPVNNSVYYSPENASVTARQLLENPKSNRGVVRFSEDGTFSESRDAILKIKEWLANPVNQRDGGIVINDMRRQLQQLELLDSKQRTQQQQTGPDGAIVNLFGSITGMLERIGGENSQQLRKLVVKFDSLLRANLHGDHSKGAIEFDALKAAARQATGEIDPQSFDRRFIDAPLNFRDQSRSIDASITAGSSDQQREDISVKAMMDYLRDPKINPVNSSLFKAKPESAKAVEAMLRQHIRNNGWLTRLLERMGIKVNDDALGILRTLIGDKSSTFGRGLSNQAYGVAGEMANTWSPASNGAKFKDAAGNEQVSLKPEVIAEMYLQDRDALLKTLEPRFAGRIWTDFVEPFANHAALSHFEGPEFNGISDMADRSNISDAYNNAQGNPVLFAELLFSKEHGDVADVNAVAQFVGKTMATFQTKYTQLNNLAGPKTGTIMDVTGTTGRSFLEAREANDLPPQFLKYHQFGQYSMQGYVRVMAENAAFGVNHQTWNRLINDMKEEQRANESALQSIVERSGNNKAVVEAELKKTGKREALLSAKQNGDAIKAIEVVFADIMKTMDGGAISEKRMFRLIRNIAGHIVQSPGAAFTDLLSLTVSPVRTFGANRVAAAVIGRNWKYFLANNFGSLMQAMGRQWHLNTQHQTAIQMSNSNGMADLSNKASALTRWRGRLADQQSFSEVYNQRQLLGDNAPLAALKAAGEATYRNALSFSDIALSAGIGANRKSTSAYPTLKPAIYSYFQQHQNLAVSLSWADTVEDLINRAVDFYQSKGVTAKRGYEVTAKDLGYQSGWVFDDARAFDYLIKQLNVAGISLDEAAHRRINGEQALNEQQASSIMALSNQEMLQEGGLNTQSTKLAGRFKILSPLLRWQFANTAALVRSFRTPSGKADARTFTNAMIAFGAAVLPASLLWAWLRDLYDEEVVGKKTNVMRFVPGDVEGSAEKNALALVDKLGRVSALGIAGDFINSAVNVDTNREFSVDSRVFYVSSIQSLLKSFQTFYKQDFNADYAGVIRPALSSLGGAGYLQTFDAINNQLGLDNMETRIVTRVNVNNLLRATGRELGLSVRTGRGQQSIPTPSKPWVGQMVTAAYLNDADGFRESYGKALESAIRDGVADPYEQVFNQYQSQFPLTVVFAEKPTERQYSMLLASLGNKADEVNRAIGNYMAYSAYLKRGKGKAGKEIDFAKPKTQTVRTRSDYRALTTSF